MDNSNVQFDGAGVVRYDKANRTPAMRHIDYGLGVFQREVFAGLAPDQPHDLAAGVPGTGEPRRACRVGIAPAVLRDRVAGGHSRPDGVSIAMTFAEQFLTEAAEILSKIDTAAVERMAALLAECRSRGGRLFVLGVGGKRGQRVARGQRFPQDLRAGGLCPHG